MSSYGDLPRLICISGPDGVGKTTQAIKLVEHLKKRGISCEYLWLRFGHFFSLPILAYLKVSGRSSVKILADGRKIGHHNIRDSMILSRVYESTLLIDMWLFGFMKMLLPRLRNHVIVCDRYVLDTIVDIIIATGNQDFLRSPICLILLRLPPKGSRFMILNSRVENLIGRRSEIREDDYLGNRINIYAEIATTQKIKLLEVSNLSVDEVFSLIQDEIEA